jgi:hypothetical protein
MKATKKTIVSRTSDAALAGAANAAIPGGVVVSGGRDDRSQPECTTAAVLIPVMAYPVPSSIL